jgi:predicted negative regulator of RcsB-dependent stress response
VARTKMTRHQLKEKDEITTSLQRFTEFVYDRQKEIIIGAGVLLVLAIAFIGWNIYASSRNAAAQTELSAAINTFSDTTNIKSDKERYEKTIVEAQKTLDAYRSLPVGVIAQYYLALSQEGLGDTAKAVQNLQEVMQRGDASIKGVAQFALASIHRKHGEPQKAIELYKQLYDSGGYSKAAVAYELAILYEANNQLDQAKDYYQKLASEFPDSPFRQEVDEAVKRLGITLPPPTPQKPS